jgi:hypothetical protein
MALELRIWDISLDAADDYEDEQFHIMYLSSEYTASLATGGSQMLVGILQNKPDAAAKACEIRRVGISKVVCGGVISVGDEITSDANGHAETATEGDRYVGIALEAGVEGRTISILMEFGYLSESS